MTATDTAARLLADYVEEFGSRGIHMADAGQIVDCLREVLVLSSRVQELEAALRSLKHQYLPYMPVCDCPTCRAIDRALSAGGTTPTPEEPT